MSTNKHEFLSALLDDEAGAFEQRRMLDELKKDDELAQAFGRYALIGEAMRAHTTNQRSTLGVSLLAGIHDALEDEPEYTGEVVVQSPQHSSVAAQPVVVKATRQWRTAGFALAAGVAALAVGGVLFLQQPANLTATVHTAQNAPTLLPASLPAPAKPLPVNAANALVVDAATEARIQQVGRIDPQTRDMLKQYVAQHVKYASTTVIAPSVRAVSYVNER